MFIQYAQSIWYPSINCMRHTDYPQSDCLTTSYAYKMSMINANRNAVVTESVTMLLVCILIDGKEILPQVL